jgi:hypothetical protein
MVANISTLISVCVCICVYVYIISGSIAPNHTSWDSIEIFNWKNGLSSSGSDKKSDDTSLFLAEQDLLNINDDYLLPPLTHKLKLKSAAGYPQYSNYTKTFKELLDYIYVEREKYEVVRIAPFPTEQVLSENCAIPSEVFPSDHLALVVDVQLLSPRGR